MGIPFYTACPGCKGTGVRTYYNDQRQQITENPCSFCGGVGKKTGLKGMDDTLILQIIEELDYIHGKVTAIWEQVKPGN